MTNTNQKQRSVLDGMGVSIAAFIVALILYLCLAPVALAANGATFGDGAQASAQADVTEMVETQVEDDAAEAGGVDGVDEADEAEQSDDQAAEASQTPYAAAGVALS